MQVSALTRKLWREAQSLKGQILTIALVLAGGIACFIALRGTYSSLEWAREAYYDRYRFADVFASLERAPESLVNRIERLDGVAAVQTRIVKEVALPIEGTTLPAYGRLLSLPASGSPATNALYLRSGRLPQRGATDEVALLEPFANKNGLTVGQRVPVILNGTLRQLRIVGLVLSPEFVYAIRPGALVDDPRRYAVLWMDRSVLASAFELDGAFNDVSLRLQPGASEAGVCAALDRLLEPWGGDGAIGRSNQVSNRILTQELSQLRALAGMVPMVFLGVAAFLVNRVLSRLISLQRSEIATLKAIGYLNAEVGRHYFALVGIVLLPGALLGTVLGWELGRRVLGLYGDVFRFPDLSFRLSSSLLGSAWLVSCLAAMGAAFFAVRSAVRLAPAEAMRPPAPAHYQRGLFERLGLAAAIGATGMMVVREVARRPLRTAVSAVGIAGAVALIILARFGSDSIARYFEATFRREQRQDLSVTFSRPVSERAVGQLARTPGVITAEGQRGIPIRVRHDHRVRDSVLVGLPEHSELRRLVEHGGREVPVPSDGVLLTKTLGQILDVRVGDRVDLDVRQGKRLPVHPLVAGFVDESVGLFVYGKQELIEALERDVGAVSSVLLTVEPDARANVVAELRRSPYVVDVDDVREDIQRLRDMNQSIMDVWTVVSIILGTSVVFGVVYNNARIALTARSRDLASLRVLGFSRREVASILIWSLALDVLLAIPLGLWLGRAWAHLFMLSVDQETFRWEVIISPRTYLLAAVVAALAAAASALWVGRSLDRLDLIGVLKTRE